MISSQNLPLSAANMITHHEQYVLACQKQVVFACQERVVLVFTKPEAQAASQLLYLAVGIRIHGTTQHQATMADITLDRITTHLTITDHGATQLGMDTHTLATYIQATWMIACMGEDILDITN